MPRPRAFRELRLLNGSTGDPCLFVDDQGRDNAPLIDCGDNAVLGNDRLADREAVFLTHHHVDHFIGFDRPRPRGQFQAYFLPGLFLSGGCAFFWRFNGDVPLSTLDASDPAARP